MRKEPKSEVGFGFDDSFGYHPKYPKDLSKVGGLEATFWMGPSPTCCRYCTIHRETTTVSEMKMMTRALDRSWGLQSNNFYNNLGVEWGTTMALWMADFHGKSRGKWMTWVYGWFVSWKMPISG